MGFQLIPTPLFDFQVALNLGETSPLTWVQCLEVQQKRLTGIRESEEHIMSISTSAVSGTTGFTGESLTTEVL